MANNFKIIYRILKILEKALEEEELNIQLIDHEALGITRPLWCRLMKILVDNGYIEGVSILSSMGSTLPGVKLVRPTITLKGMEYLEENSLMHKAANLAKGIKEFI